MTSACQLYRHFDKDEVLLYVGISLHAMARLSGHKKTSGWFAEIARVSVETYESKKAAVLAETAAIKAEKPKYNIVHSKTPKLATSELRRERKKSSASTEASKALNRATQAKWRTANLELNRQRARDGMRKRRAQTKDI